MQFMAMEERSRTNRMVPDALRSVRLRNGWTLADMALKTGISTSSLSKIENGKYDVSYTKLMKIAQDIGVDIAQLLDRKDTAPLEAGRMGLGTRAVTRSSDVTIVEDGNYTHHCHAAELLRRSLHPLIMEVKARSVDEFGELRSHAGEEFTYVLEGTVDFHSELYAPTRLYAGDSIYFEASMGHAWVAVSEGSCRILSVFNETAGLDRLGS